MCFDQIVKNSTVQYVDCAKAIQFSGLCNDKSFIRFIFSLILHFIHHWMYKMPFLSQLRFAIFWSINIDCFFLSCGAYIYVYKPSLPISLCIFYHMLK